MSDKMIEHAVGAGNGDDVYPPRMGFGFLASANIMPASIINMGAAKDPIARIDNSDVAL